MHNAYINSTVNAYAYSCASSSSFGPYQISTRTIRARCVSLSFFGLVSPSFLLAKLNIGTSSDAIQVLHYILYHFYFCCIRTLQPSHYLGHLLGHEGRGSLLAELKRRGWANTIVAGEQDGARGFSTFHMAVDLTEAGLANANRVVELAFQYLAMLREAGPRRDVHDELRDLGTLRFRFKDKENPVSYATHLASALHV